MRIKILFLINSLGGGGAEKVLVNLVNNMDSEKFDITVKTMFYDGVNRERLNPNISYSCKHALNVKGISKIYRFIPPSVLFKKFVGSSKYDIIVGFMHNVPIKTIVGCNCKETVLIGWCHCGTVKKQTYCTCWFNKKLAQNDYNKCDALVGVSNRIVDEFNSFFDISTKCCTVYNTNDVALITKLSNRDVEIDTSVPSICTVGRLSFEKGNDRIIKVAKRLSDKGYKFNLYILGDGKEKDNLNKLVKDLDISSVVHFMGYQENPYPYIKNCDFYVCPSRIEGLSTSVTEAILLNKPVVSTDVSGANEILGYNNEYGIVVDNSEDGLYDGVRMLLDDNDKMNLLTIKAKERAAFFDTSNTVKQAEDLFISLLKAKESYNA